MPSAVDPPSPGERYQRFRAPKTNNATLVVPAVSDLLALVQSNREQVAASSLDLHGRSLAELATAARRRLVELATGYTWSFCDAPAADSERVLVSGHQPDLFHPGVWFKNHLLDHLAKQTGAVGVHLLIDSDLCRNTGVRVPRGTGAAPRWETVAIDNRTSDLPYEERPIVDRDFFAPFATRIATATEGLIDHPLAKTMWPDAIAAARDGANLGESLSRARRLVEQRWGSTTLELPLSRLCDAQEMQWGLALALAELPRVHAAYNAALADYRAAHRLRSPAQPLPNLAQEDRWFEAPLWVWTAEDPTRRPLFARLTRDEIVLSNRAGNEWRLPCSADRPLTDTVDQIAKLRRVGMKLRPRALITTLLARLLLGDLFLHGIGGAKYDQVTDELARRWLGITPPPHATATATLRLPIDHPIVAEPDATRLRVRLREMEFHPERFLVDPDSGAPDEEAAAAIQRKRNALAFETETGAERHRRIVAANLELRRLILEQRQATTSELELLQDRLRASQVLDSREYSFCLYPEENLRQRYKALLDDR